MTVLITGATGSVGAPLVAALHQRGTPVRALVRDPDRARTLLGGSVELVTGDLAEPHTLRPALTGVEQVFLACANVPHQVRYECDLIDAAAEAGVRRLVKLSAVGARPGSPAHFWDWHGRIEAHLHGSGVPAVVLRPTFYMSNLLASAATVQHTGKLFAPAGGAKIAMIDPADVARAAAVALTEAGHVGRTYTVTGPEAITYDDVAAELSAATGRSIEFVDVPDQAMRDALLQAGTPSWLADQLVAIFERLREGAAAQTTEAVHALTGKPPRGIRAFVTDHTQAFQPS